MAILTENENSFFLSTPAVLFDDTVDVASEWASKHIQPNRALKWIIAKYVEADNANSNGQYWTLSDLQKKQSTINHSPMNVGHDGSAIVGTWVAAEMMYPLENASALNPYIETVGVIWKHYFPEVMKAVEEAYETGSLFISMECQGDSITCGGDEGCGQTFDYAGPMSETYCQCIRDRAGHRQINNPHFLAGALILPPDRPGWAQAAVKELAKEEQDSLMAQVSAEAPELDAAEWEKIMLSLQAHAAAKSRNNDTASKTPASLIGMQIASSFMARSYQ